jgi:hypothetical protein
VDFSAPLPGFQGHCRECTDFVEDGYDLDPPFPSDVEDGYGLRLDPLTGVDEKQGSLTGCKGARDLPREIDMSLGKMSSWSMTSDEQGNSITGVSMRFNK